MSERAAALRDQLIRNFDELPKERELRAAAVRHRCAPGSAPGTAAQRARHERSTSSRPACAAARTTCTTPRKRRSSILEGRGTLRVAGELLEIKAGDVAFLPAGPGLSAPDRQHLGRAAQVPVDQHAERPEIVEYPDSGKYLAIAGASGPAGFARMARLDRTSTTGKGSPEPSAARRADG